MLYENKTNCVVYRDNAGQIHEFANTKVGFIRHIKYLIDQTLFTQPWDTTARERFNRDYNYYCERHGVSAITPAPQDYIYGAFAYQAYEKILYLVGSKYSTLIDQAARYLEEKATKVNDFAPSPMSYCLNYGRLYDGCDNRYLRPINMVRGYSITGRRTFYRDEVFELQGYYLEKTLKKLLKTCEDCGSKYFDQDDFTSRQCDFLPQDLVGIDCYCRECALDRDWRACDVCGRLECSDDMYWIEGDEELICEDCYESGDYACCDHCGDYFRTDSDYAIYTENGYHFCCETCAEREGYAWDEDNECWDSEENIADRSRSRLIADYHSTYFAFVGLELKPKSMLQDLGFGIEIEVWGDDPYDHEEFWADTIKAGFLHDGLYGNLEHDGSVTAEIVTQPFTEKAFKKFDLEGMYKALVEQGYTGHNNDHCGQHIHFSRGYLGYNHRQIKNNAKKIAAFFENHWKELVKISRRTESQLHWCNKFGFAIDKNTDFEALSYDRYHAVNLTNLFTSKRGTIEIRLPRGTLKASTTRATVDFFLHIVRNAKDISWKNINNLKLWFKGIKDKNTIDYIKSRNAFEGEF